MDVQAALSNSIDEVLDKMAFLFFDELAEDPGEGDFSVVTEVNVKGVVSGKLNILVSQSAAKEIARNLIGIRDEDELFQGTLEDALLEFTNLVMGRTMTILNPAGPFDMEVPQIVAAPAAAAQDHQTITITGGLDDEPIRFVFQYQDTPN